MTADRPPTGTTRHSAPTIVGFTSPTNGIGRTGVVANLAWVLAAAGKKVAVADWCAEAPHVHDYLKPFHVRDLSANEYLDEVLADTPRTPQAEDNTYPPMEVRRYELPDSQARIDVVVSRDPATPVRGFMPALDEPGEVQKLREGIRAAAYDYVLIDAPTNLTSDAATRMARLADVVAVCFLPTQSSIGPAALMARTIWDETTTSTRIIAVRLQAGNGDDAQAARSSRAIAAAFGSMSRGGAPTGGRELALTVAEIPYHQHNTFEETLAVLVDEHAAHRAAYWRLGNTVTGADLGAPRELPPPLLANYKHAVGVRTESPPAEVMVAWAAADRPWADWIRAQLTQAGARVTRAMDVVPAGTTLVVISSAEFTRSAAAQRVLRMNNASHLVVATITDDRVPEPLTKGIRVQLAGAEDEHTARGRLLAAFSLVAGAASATVRFPGRTDMRPTNAPPASVRFVGRDAQLEAMRDHLTAGVEPRVWTLTGDAGIGKSELARKYAHRFAFDYEHVWWLNAQDRRTITEGIARLAQAMRLDTSGDLTRKVFDRLAASPSGERWLLVYDNADDPEVLHELVPRDGPAHVVITSRAVEQPNQARLEALARAESIALLRGYVGDLNVEDAESIADLVEHLPLALNLAGAWLRETARHLRQQHNTREGAAAWAAVEFRERFEQQTSEQVGGVPDCVVRTLRVVVATLRAEHLGEAAVRIAQLCVFLSSEGVALRVLRSAPVLAAMAGTCEGVSCDELDLDRVLWFGDRYGLFNLRWTTPASVGTHRLVQRLVRELTSPDELAARQAMVLSALAAFTPTESEIDNFERMADMRELRKHIVVSGAAGSTATPVRRWLVNQMRFFMHEGDEETLRFAISVSQEVLANWAQDDEPGLRMQLRFHVANLYRSLGDAAEALRLDRALLDEQDRVLGRDHPRTLRTARGLAHGLRVLGRFEDAVTEDRATVRRFRVALGDDHPDTLRATHNLAFSLYLFGDTGKALKVQKANRDRRRGLLGDEHLDVWWSTCEMGRYLRELGRCDEALTEPKEAFDRVVSMKPSNPRHELLIQWEWAITLRRSGKCHQARDKTAETVKRYRLLHGEDHGDTQACQLSYAADFHATHEPATAVSIATSCFGWFQRTLGEYHPFTLLCQLDLAVFLRAAGHQEAALREALGARDGLRRVLNDAHPWSLAAAINHEVIRGQSDGAGAVMGQLQEIYENCLEYLGPVHPITATVSANLSARPAEWKDVVLDVPEM